MAGVSGRTRFVACSLFLFGLGLWGSLTLGALIGAARLVVVLVLVSLSVLVGVFGRLRLLLTLLKLPLLLSLFVALDLLLPDFVL